MATLPKFPKRSPEWSAEAKAMAAQAKVLSGNKLEQFVLRLQRHSGRTKEACWRFIIQYGIKGKVDYRRWTEPEIDAVREELVKRSVEDVAKKLNRTPKAIRNMLERNHLTVREIRCDLFITPEALIKLYKQHQSDLLKRGIRNQSLFEAYLQYCYSPKHTVGEQLLDVRRDKRERDAFASVEAKELDCNEDEEKDDEDEEAEVHCRTDMEGTYAPRGDSESPCK